MNASETVSKLLETHSLDEVLETMAEICEEKARDCEDHGGKWYWEFAAERLNETANQLPK